MDDACLRSVRESACESSLMRRLADQEFTLDIDDGLQMLAALEVYASECYDCTASHHASIIAMEVSDAVIAYDFTVGYPPKLVFN